MEFSIPVVSGIIPGANEKDRARQAVLCTILNPFGNDQEEKNLMMITLFLRRYITKHIVNAIKMRFFWITVTKSAGLRIADREFQRPSEVPVLRQSHRDPRQS